ncbi:MAG: hypothetical protein BroJett022_07730 [Actinomycetes bacterium]|nr:MAG: hypothetical protein BroJett022_07730 [Actinomycetes bacterium]
MLPPDAALTRRARVREAARTAAALESEPQQAASGTGRRAAEGAARAPPPPAAPLASAVGVLLGPVALPLLEGGQMELCDHGRARHSAASFSSDHGYRLEGGEELE